ncbi:ABC transporter domain-containing protein, partial [Rozella allomycis CSF55]
LIWENVIVIYTLIKAYKVFGSDQHVTALKELNLNYSSPFPPIRKGEFVILRGPSGGGKTTLLNMIGTIDVPTTGTISFVFQTFNLLATMSAFENVELPMTILGKLNPKERKERVEMLLRLVGLQDRMAHLPSELSGGEQQRPSELSGGEQQRVTIARSMANDPNILLLDEPTGDLDTFNTVEIMDLLLKINLEKKTTCVMVTHNPDVECYADRILYLEDGKFVKQVYNRIQVALVFEDYNEYLKNQDLNKQNH